MTSTQEILTRARAIADMEDDFVTETMWMYWMNQANKQLALFIARAGYLHEECTSALTATGAVAYSIPQPLAIVAVHELDTSGRVRRLEAANAVEGFQYLASPAAVGKALKWRATSTRGGLINIALYPSPASGTYLVTVIKQPPELVLADPSEVQSDEVLYPMGWEEWIVLEMAKRALMKEEGDARGLVALQKQVENFVEENVWSRTIADSPTVRDSRQDSTDAYAIGYYGVPASWRFF